MSDLTPDAEIRPQSSTLTAFLVIWGGQIFSLLGSSLVQFALVWYLTRTTGSATVLAVATMMALLPQIVIGPVAGALVDRWNRRVVMIVADSAIALATALLAVLYALDVVQVWHIYLLMFVRAVGGAFHWPAMQASTSLMVPEKHLSRVAGMNQALWGLASIVSPPLGALLIGVLPMQGVLAIDVSTALIAIGPLLFIAVPQPVRQKTPDVSGQPVGEVSVLTDLKAGLRFTGSWPGLLLISLIAALINLLVTPAFSLMPILVTRHFGGGALQLAWTETTWGIGVVLGGLLLGVWGGFKRRVVTGLSALALMGVGVIVVGLTPSNAYLLALAALFLGGLMNPICNGSFFASLQSTVPAEMQGRVFTLVMSVCGLMSPLGLAVAGPVADALGVQVWFLAGGVATIAMGLGGFLVPAIMNMEEDAQTRFGTGAPQPASLRTVVGAEEAAAPAAGQ